ncbi:MAG: hypothetical protein R3A79_31500 [Nannocystaceae bacterium]
MNIRSLFALSALTLTLAACSGDDTSSDSETTTATTTTTSTSSTSSSTTDTTTDSTTDSTTDTTTDTTTDSTSSTTTTTTESTGETSTTDTTTTGGAELSCDAYCDLYLSACGDFTEYDNNESCLAQCAQWPEGELDATSGDSLGCRLYHATVAESTDANIHCPHAGPSGGSAADDAVCVDEAAPTCDNYCKVYFGNCTGDNDVYEGDNDACMSACKNWYAGSEADTAGDTIGCRTYHAGAALGDPALHCPHASPSGGGVCTVG